MLVFRVMAFLMFPGRVRVHVVLDTSSVFLWRQHFGSPAFNPVGKMFASAPLSGVFRPLPSLILTDDGFLNKTSGISFSNLMILEILEGGGTVFKLSKQNPIPLALALDRNLFHPNRKLLSLYFFCQGLCLVSFLIGADLDAVLSSGLCFNADSIRGRDLLLCQGR